jgi:hypothetical protein
MNIQKEMINGTISAIKRRIKEAKAAQGACTGAFHEIKPLQVPCGKWQCSEVALDGPPFNTFVFRLLPSCH